MSPNLHVVGSFYVYIEFWLMTEAKKPEKSNRKNEVSNAKYEGLKNREMLATIN